MFRVLVMFIDGKPIVVRQKVEYRMLAASLMYRGASPRRPACGTIADYQV